MLLSRRVSLVLIAIALFQVVSFLNLARNIADAEGKDDSFYVIHALLIIANLAIATFLGYLGTRGLKGMDEVALRKYFDDRELDGVTRV